uniref:Uncharacterized protein n=1 Tax=Strigamia maritima TaxID=126957 RepID=T1J942_STRMM
MKLCLLLFVLVVAFALNEALDVKCYWDGTAPFCNGSCKPKENVCSYSNGGDGSMCWSGRKVRCCNVLLCQ